MAIPYESTGRAGQKSRTRQRLVEAARDLLAGGAAPRVEDAAQRAGISRTTAYRYFPNQRCLLLAAQPTIGPKTLLGDDAPDDPQARLDTFMTAFTRYNFDWEPQLRTSLRLSLEPVTSIEQGRAQAVRDSQRSALRQGNAIAWIEDALAPLRDSHPQVDRTALAVAIRSATGIESLIWLVDIAGMTREQAAETVRRTAQALLAAATAGH